MFSGWDKVRRMNDNEFKSPGQLIKHLLEERGWTRRVLAVVLGVDETGIIKLVNSDRPVSAEMAILLGEVFGIEPERFWDLQKSYDLAKARLLIKPDPERTTRAQLFAGLPVSEMIKRRWLIGADDIRDVQNVETALAKFFGVDSVSNIEILPHAAKKTRVSIPATPAQLAWLYRVKEIAIEMLVPRYSPSAVRNAVAKLGNLLLAPEEVRKVPRILAESGIRYAIVESIGSAKIDGVCFWLNDLSPVIGMSLRLDRIDNFWFVLRHELEHVLQLHGKAAAMLDTELDKPDGSAQEEEQIANEAAAKFCAPKLDRFIARKAPFFAERDILGFANTMNIHPGLVAGQLQYKTGRYDLFRNHLVKIRHLIAPSAVVDGWGDVVPVG
jgi:HTH-type transcriptional regulator/antitoxin HigA